MLIAFTAAGKGGLKADVDQRFGRAPHFVIVDTESGDAVDEFDNPAIHADHGAGPQAAALVAEHGARGVVSGDFGPKAQAALEGLGLGMWKIKDPTTVEETLRLYREGGLEEIKPPR
ncbi:MAG TPA: NifB/NifX family molybdenum-iron cluster-binding protein [bacterium]|nr:NifB/NifX family molybdenum-iron cluster-binding protein [bacterium]